MVPRLIRICGIPWWCSIFMFYSRNTFMNKFGPNNQNCQFKLKFDTTPNSNKQNFMVVFFFSALDQKYSFWAKLVQKIKLLSLGLILVPRLTRIYRIPYWCLLFPFKTRNTLFEQFWSTKSKLLI